MVFAADYRTAVSAIVELRLCQGVRANYASEYGFESVIAGVDYFGPTTTINLPWIKRMPGVAGFAAATAYYSYFAYKQVLGGRTWSCTPPSTYSLKSRYLPWCSCFGLSLAPHRQLVLFVEPGSTWTPQHSAIDGLPVCALLLRFCPRHLRTDYFVNTAGLHICSVPLASPPPQIFPTSPQLAFPPSSKKSWRKNVV
jgi:hypothetical protein